MSTGAFSRPTGRTPRSSRTRTIRRCSRVVSTGSTTTAPTCTWSCSPTAALPTGSSTRFSTRSRTRRCWRSPRVSGPSKSRVIAMTEKPAIGIFGAGWVGLVTGACFADLGHRVVVRDVVEERIALLNAGRLPFHEADLPEVIERNRERLTFTLDAEELTSATDLFFACVDTPPTPSGDADLSSVWSVIDDMGDPGEGLLVMKSTVPVGTGERIRRNLDDRGLQHVGYVSNT